jgi:hypothetical protein
LGLLSITRIKKVRKKDRKNNRKKERKKERKRERKKEREKEVKKWQCLKYHNIKLSNFNLVIFLFFTQN